MSTSSRIHRFDASSKYTISCGGKAIETTVTNKAIVVHQWIEEINALYAEKSTVVVGLDIEWRPNYSRYMNNKAATLQLCIDDKCLILQLFYIDNLPLSLKNFLMNPKFTFAGVEVADDISKISDDYVLNCGVHADIRELANEKWPGRYSRPGLKDLAMDVIGLSMKKPKHVSMSNWEARVLSIEQIEYGCIDAYASYKIGHKLLMEDG
ncbi:hypothetical protein PIB30_026075 [Stylosanthes scabra]|uniref:3'-5' exonuclease domain-containing protein n=1 Tax=Stylosanthes scabra TaxID=79078 RepID=A0ABU6Y993_9FABA|nr:hypothetical protein [Stylosanthes scabra]